MVLTTKQAEVMKLLLNAGENGVTFRELNKLRGKTNSRQICARIAKKLTVKRSW
jgi:hypothetical protein